MNNYLDCEGTFECEVGKPVAGWIQRSEKGTPYICLRLEVVDDVDAGKIILWNGYLSDKAFDRTINTLIEAFGFDGDLSRFNDNGPGLEGMRCQIVSEFQEYNGKKYIKVKYLNKCGYVYSIGKIEGQELSSLISQFSGRAKKLALAAQAPKPITEGDDDIPL